MKDPPSLEALFLDLKNQRLPPPPPNLEANVWRRIRLASAEPLGWCPPFWPKWFANPTAAALFVAFSVVSGVFVAANLESVPKGSNDTSTVTTTMAVFTENAPGLIRSPLLSHAR